MSKGEELYNSRSRQKLRVGRLVRMHADKMEDITEACCGDIVALFGVDCASGDTLTRRGLAYSMTSMFVPEPVISLAIKAKDKKAEDQLAKALNRFTKEDPTFRTHVDPESRETIISGMGELHLDVYLERMRREYRAEVETGDAAGELPGDHHPRRPSSTTPTRSRPAAPASTPGWPAASSPTPRGSYEFVNEVRGGRIPTEFIPSCDKGFKACLPKGGLIGFPVIGVKVTMDDGAVPLGGLLGLGLPAWRPSAPSARPTSRRPPRSWSRS